MNPSGEFWLGEGKGKGGKADRMICALQQGKEDKVQKWSTRSRDSSWKRGSKQMGWFEGKMRQVRGRTELSALLLFVLSQGICHPHPGDVPLGFCCARGPGSSQPLGKRLRWCVGQLWSWLWGTEDMDSWTCTAPGKTKQCCYLELQQEEIPTSSLLGTSQPGQPFSGPKLTFLNLETVGFGGMLGHLCGPWKHWMTSAFTFWVAKIWQC